MSVPSIPAAELVTAMLNGEKPVVIDIRTPAEFAAKRLADAETINIKPHEVIEKLNALFPDKTIPLHFLCIAGETSKEPVRKAVMAGYSNARTIEGGFRLCERLGARIKTAPASRPPVPR